MKYIKTKYGIFKVKAIVKNLSYKTSINSIEFDIPKDDVLKQADTIEDLCDAFIEVHKVLQNEIFDRPYFDIVRKEVAAGGSVGNLYGAIWTKNGLEYVAKMNAKGELELI